MTDPVVVVGNGPVSQTAALFLAKRGLSVVVLDRRPGRDALGSRAICHQRDTLDIWASIAAGDRTAAGASPGLPPTPSTAGRSTAQWSRIDTGRSDDLTR